MGDREKSMRHSGGAAFLQPGREGAEPLWLLQGLGEELVIFWPRIFVEVEGIRPGKTLLEVTLLAAAQSMRDRDDQKGQESSGKKRISALRGCKGAFCFWRILGKANTQNSFISLYFKECHPLHSTFPYKKFIFF